MSSAASVTSVSPTSGPVAGGTPITIFGSGFTGATAVAFGGIQVNVSPSDVTDTQISISTPQSPAGMVDVQVDVPTGLSPANPQATFTFDAPVISSVSPAAGPITGGTSVTISGSGFTGATTVAFGGTQVTVPAGASDSQIVVDSPSASIAGTVDIQINLPTGLTPATPKAVFQYISPSITKIHPAQGPVTGGTTVTIVGSYLGSALTVQFGGVAAAQAPVVISESEITAIAPQATKEGPVGVQVNLPTGLVPASASDAPQFTYAPPGPPVNAQFVVRNQTGVPDELVFVKFLGAPIVTTSIEQSYAGWKPLNTGPDTAAKSYSLLEMSSLFGPNNESLPNFAINNYSGGRIYFSLVLPLASTTIPAAQNPNDPDFNTVYGYVEPSVFPNLLAGNTNIDASYVDFVGIPIDIAIRNSADGSLANPPANNPLTTPGGTALFTALTGDSNIPAATQVAAKGSGFAHPDISVAIGGTARILSPSLYDAKQITDAQPYHGWTGAGSLIDTLRTNQTQLIVASYVVGQGTASVPANTLFGFAGSKATSPIGTAWVAAQSYSLIATAVSDLNPNGANPRISQLAGVKGMILSGSGDTVGAIAIYLTDSDLEAQTGIYGANPPYIVDWLAAPGGATAYSIPGIVNDLGGRVVGDLLAGFNFGWAASTTVVATQATATNTAANLAGTVFDVTSGPLAQSAIGALSTGTFFYLLSLQPDTAAVAQWFGASIQPGQPTFYNNYASDFQKLTNAYNMAFTDRLQGASDPDMFFTPGDSTYVEITLLPGAYTVTKTKST